MFLLFPGVSLAGILSRRRKRWQRGPFLLISKVSRNMMMRYAAIDKAERLIGYKPLVFFEEGFETNINWFKENWELIEKYADFPPGMSSAVKNVG